MANGAFSSAEVLTNGEDLKIVFSEPAGGWQSPYTVSEDPRDWPVLDEGSGDNLSKIHLEDVPHTVSSPSLNGTDLEITVELIGYVFSGETVTIDTVQGWITDSSSNESGATTGSSVTNSSSATQGNSHTRIKGKPVAQWAFLDSYPSSTTHRVALAAYENFNGIKHIDIQFDSAVTVSSDPEVTSQGSNTYRIASQRWASAGYGLDSLPYWYLDVDVSGESDGDVASVTEVTIETHDGKTRDLISDGVLEGITLTRSPSSPSVIYVDPTSTGGNNDGTSWADAYTTTDLDTIESNVTSSTDEVRLAPDTYTGSSTTFDQNQTSIVRWIGDTSRTGDSSGQITFSLSGTVNFKDWQCFEDITFDIASGGTLRTQSSTHNYWIRCPFDFTDKNDSTNLPSNAVNHFAYLNATIQDGYRGFGFGRVGTTRPKNIWLTYDMDNSGSTFTGAPHHILAENLNSTNCAGSDYPSSTHFDKYHAFAKQNYSGGDWTESSKTVTTTGGFSNAEFTAGMSILQVNSGTGANTGAYEVASKIDGDQVTLESSPTGGADITDGTMGGNFSESAGIGVILRYCYDYDNGLISGTRAYNLALLENSTKDVVIANCALFNVLNNQQIIQMHGLWNNVQVVHCTLITQDEQHARGIQFSGSNTSTPYKMSRGCFRNNILHRIEDSPGDHLTGQAPKPYIRALAIGPNLISQQSTGFVEDGSLQTDTEANSSFDLADLSTSPYDLHPNDTSKSIGLAVSSDVIWDMDGEDILQDGTGDVGAFQTSGASASAPQITGISTIAGLSSVTL